MPTNNVYLYIGTDESQFVFARGSKPWEEVRDQITAATSAGRGLISIPRPIGGRAVYVYSPALLIRWVEERD